MQGILWNFYDCDELAITDTDLGQENGFIDLPRVFQHWNSIIWPLLGLPGKSKYFLQQVCLFNYKENRPWKFFTYPIAIRYYSYKFSSVNIYLKWNISKTIYFGFLQHWRITADFAVPLQIDCQCQKILYSSVGINLILVKCPKMVSM